MNKVTQNSVLNQENIISHIQLVQYFLCPSFILGHQMNTLRLFFRINYSLQRICDQTNNKQQFIILYYFLLLWKESFYFIDLIMQIYNLFIILLRGFFNKGIDNQKIQIFSNSVILALYDVSTPKVTLLPYYEKYYKTISTIII